MPPHGHCSRRHSLQQGMHLHAVVEESQKCTFSIHDAYRSAVHARCVNVINLFFFAKYIAIWHCLLDDSSFFACTMHTNGLPRLFVCFAGSAAHTRAGRAEAERRGRVPGSRPRQGWRHAGVFPCYFSCRKKNCCTAPPIHMDLDSFMAHIVYR